MFVLNLKLITWAIHLIKVITEIKNTNQTPNDFIIYHIFCRPHKSYLTYDMTA